MTYKPVSTLTLDEAKEIANALIGNITEFLDTIEQALPAKGYGHLSSNIKQLNQQLQSCSTPFLTENEVDLHVNQLLQTFTTMHPNIERNLQKLFDAYKEIGSFLDNNKGAFDFKLLDFGSDDIQKMVDINKNSNIIMTQLKQQNYTDTASLLGIFSIHSSKVETSESYFLDELIQYRDKINQFVRNRQISYSVGFDPVDIVAVGSKIQRRDGKYYTEAKAIRHLIDHHHYKLENDGKVCTIHFKSPNDPSWQFNYDRKFTCEEFFNFLAELDTFYKSAVNLLMSIQLLGVLRQCFVKKP